VVIDAHPKVEDFNGYYKFKGINKWVKGMDLDEQNNLLCCWNAKSVYLYNFLPMNLDISNNIASSQFLSEEEEITIISDLRKTLEKDMLKPICKYKGLTEDDDFVTDIKLVNRLHYLVVSTNMGAIEVYKWDRKTGTK
jgi:hypothetical protein